MPRQHESRFCSPSFFLNSFLFFSLPWTKLNRGTEHRPYEFCRKQNRDELIFQEARVCARWIIFDVHVFMCSKFWKHRHYFLYHKGKVFIFVISFHISTLFTYITLLFWAENANKFYEKCVHIKNECAVYMYMKYQSTHACIVLNVNMTSCLNNSSCIWHNWGTLFE